MTKIVSGKVLAVMMALALTLSVFAGFAPVLSDNGAQGGALVEEAYAISDLLDGVTTTDDPALATQPDADMEGILGRYKNIVMAITGFLTVTMFAAMLFQFSKLGLAGDNEQARRKAIGGILTTGIATALLGGATIVIGFFYNAVSGTSSSGGGGGGGGTP